MTVGAKIFRRPALAVLALVLAVFGRTVERFDLWRAEILGATFLPLLEAFRTTRRLATPRFCVRAAVPFLCFLVADFLLRAMRSR